MAISEHKTAAYKVIHTEKGNIYQFFCERSGRLVHTTKPYKERAPEAELEKAWHTEGIHFFNRCTKCKSWVDTVMFNPDVLMCVDCAPIEETANYCKHCGAKAKKGAVVCARCKKPLLYGGGDTGDSA